MRAKGIHARPMPRGLQLNMRVPAELVDRLDKLAANVPGWTRTIVARVAMEKGLADLEADERFAPRDKGSGRGKSSEGCGGWFWR